jgi:hypothetical protein
MTRQTFVAGYTCLLLDLAELEQAIRRIHYVVTSLANPIGSMTAEEGVEDAPLSGRSEP